MNRSGALAVSLWFCAVFFAGAFQYGAARPRDAAAFAAAMGLGGVLLSLSRRADRVREMRIGWPALLLPAAAIAQTIPLPLFALAVLSPVRAADWTALASTGAGDRFLALSASPAATWLRLLQAATCIAAFSLARGLARVAGSRRDLAALPVLACGMLEAVFGLLQWASGSPVTGTFVNRNHFACLLAMTLPLAAGWRAPRPWMAWIAASIPAAAIVASGSRAGLLAAAVGLAAVRSGRMVGIVALGAAVAAAFLRSGSAPAERLGIWRDTLALIADHPWTGCGLGAFEAAFPRYQTTSVTGTVDFAHNDYLQIVAELGVPLGLAFAGVLLRWLWRAAPSGRAGFGSAAAFAAHGFFDFNLYIPLNAAAAFWAAGAAEENDA